MSAVPSKISRARAGLLATILLTGSSLVTASGYSGEMPSTTPLAISNGSGAIGFDDLGFSSALHKVIVPAAQTGKLVLIDPGSNKLEEIGGFSSRSGAGGGHDEGVTSADVGRGAIFTADRSEKTLDVVDPGTKTIIAKTKLASGPDYVRFVTPTDEVWVTEPHKSQIEIFSSAGARPSGTQPFGGDQNRQWPRVIGDRRRAWPRVCQPLDRLYARDRSAQTRGGRAMEKRMQRLRAASRSIRCAGFFSSDARKASSKSLRLKDGHHVGEVSSGDGVDIIAYAPNLHHAYLPGAASATMAVVGISASGKAAVLATVPTATGIIA